MNDIVRRMPRIGWCLPGWLFVCLNVGAQTTAAPAPAVKAGGKADLQLDPAVIKGQQGLPKVLNIVPWKRPDDGGLPGRPATSLMDDALSPLDRNEMRRQLRYQQDLEAPASTTN